MPAFRYPEKTPSGHPNLLNMMDGGLVGFIVKLINSFIDSLFGGLTGGNGNNSLFPNLGNLVGDLFGTKQQVKEVKEVDVPRLDNRIDELAGGVQQFTFGSTGTFTKPAGATRIAVTLVGGGAGGSRYTRTQQPGGGCGGWTKWYEFLASDVPSSVTVTVGNGGAGRTQDGTLGLPGGESKFGSLLTVGGGQCLAAGAQPGYGTELYYNGSGGKGAQANSDPAGAGGNGPFSAGGAPGVTSGGSANGGDGISPGTGLIGPGSGGGGGANVSGAAGNGGNGGYPGGGGGGGGNYQTFGTIGNGGNGAPGAVWVRVYFN